MKIKAGLLIVAAAGALIAVQSAKAPAGFGFSKRSIRGGYASTFQGTVIENATPLLINGTAVLTADGNGNISGRESFEFDGTVCTNVTTKGTYTVNPDGSGTTSITFTGSSQDCSGSYTQTLAIAASGSIVVLNNTNTNPTNQISETWRQQNSSPF
jgi:hypothetical protein